MKYPVPALWRIRPVSVHDGDTIHAIVDRGISETALWAIRLKDTFAPELSQPGGPECRAFAQAWVSVNGDGSDWPLLLETFRTPLSDTEVVTLSRYVGRVTAANGKCLNDDVEAFIKAQGYGGGIGSPGGTP
jgi:hypothetical protein